MDSFAEAHQQSMSAIADRNSEALAAAVEKITATLIHTSPEVPSPVSSPSPSAHPFSVADKGAAYIQHRHILPRLPQLISVVLLL